jgi:HSP20 family protein
MSYYPRTDIYQNDDGLVIEAAIPGLSVENVKLEFVNTTLIISGEHKERNQHARYTSKELFTGYFSRSYIINTKIFNVEKIVTKVFNGFLRVVIPYIQVKHSNEVRVINIKEEN